jgi:hypothetical protein
MCRPVRGSGRASWRGARGSRRRRSLKAQQCVRPGRPDPAVPHPWWGGTGRAERGPTE